jgi:hypothetical protein
MKWLPGLLWGLLLFLSPNASYGQDVEIRVISDEVVWPVDSSNRARLEDWWLINPSGDSEDAIKVSVAFGQPFCGNEDIGSCDSNTWSQKVDVRAVEDGDRQLTAPYYLVKGDLAWQKARRISGWREFDLETDRSEIEVSISGLDYLLSRTLSGDKYRVGVSIRSGATEQEIYSCRTGGPSYPVCGDEGFEEILWVGDLDGDGRLDLLAQFTEKYSLVHYFLYTSGTAGNGEFVALSAEYSRYTD